MSLLTLNPPAARRPVPAAAPTRTRDFESADSESLRLACSSYCGGRAARACQRTQLKPGGGRRPYAGEPGLGVKLALAPGPGRRASESVRALTVTRDSARSHGWPRPPRPRLLSLTVPQAQSAKSS